MGSPRFPCKVDSEGRLVPIHSERTKRYIGKEVWASVFQHEYMPRSDQSNKYLFGVVYRAIADETGNDPLTVHEALKREAVRVGVLEPQYVLMGDKLFEDRPTTKVEQEQFSAYVDWIKAGCLHGDLVGMRIEIPEPA